MNVHVSENAGRFIRSQVQSGRFASEGQVIEEALRVLKEQGHPLTGDDFQQRLLKIGLMSQLPDTGADVDDPDDQPIAVEGEPLSETVIRERR